MSSIDVVAYIRRILGDRDIVVVDVGANDGEEIVSFASEFTSYRVHAFEPDPRAAARFRTRWRDNAISLLESAVGDIEGSVTFYQSAGVAPDKPSSLQSKIWDQSGSIRKPIDHIVQFPWCRFDRQIEIPITTLDSWSGRADVKTVDVLWLDVQGAELAVIKGGQKLLASTKIIYTEFSETELYEGAPDLDGVITALPSFVPVLCNENNVLLVNRTEHVFNAALGIFDRAQDLMEKGRSATEIGGRLQCDDLRRRLSDVQADRLAKDELIGRLLEANRLVEAGRQDMDNLLKRLVEERAAIDADRAAKDELLTRLVDETEVINADRAAKDVVIASLIEEREVIDRARKAQDEVIARLVRENAKVV